MSDGYICAACKSQHRTMKAAYACFLTHEREQREAANTALESVSAADLLNRASSLMAERGQIYDKPDGQRSMGRAVQAFNAITGRDLSESEGWLLLQVLKDVRLFTREGYHADSAEDCITYAALKAEAKGGGR